MIGKTTKHEPRVLKELKEIAYKASVMSEEKISVDAVIRLACLRLIIDNSRNPVKITKEIIKDTEFKARKINE